MADLQTYRNMLRINRHRLDDELEIQSEIMDKISQQVNTLNSRMLEAKENLLRVEARLLMDIPDSHGTKLTVSQLDGEVKRHPERREAWSKYERARFDFDEWEALRDAWKQRGFSIKTLADLYTSHYFTVSDHQVRDRSDRNQDRIYNHQQAHRERRAAERDVRAARDEPTARSPRRRTLSEG